MKNAFLSVCALFLAVSSVSAAWPSPDTHQKKCLTVNLAPIPPDPHSKKCPTLLPGDVVSSSLVR
jgi:hypothetical protein